MYILWNSYHGTAWFSSTKIYNPPPDTLSPKELYFLKHHNCDVGMLFLGLCLSSNDDSQNSQPNTAVFPAWLWLAVPKLKSPKVTYFPVPSSGYQTLSKKWIFGVILGQRNSVCCLPASAGETRSSQVPNSSWTFGIPAPMYFYLLGLNNVHL